ncbi:MAG: RsmB/NOP family class I SAM-dependent RNA methyltransferase [Verrucomicrobiota bacterium]|nr:RsmB/NOP family class I SAM-dependent RNA methyltransferase [Verrucomicrobiota bacterium]
MDLCLSEYFRSHKSLGANDRRKVGEAIYVLVRWKSLFDCLEPFNSSFKRLSLYHQKSIEEWRKDPRVEEAARFGLSPFLFKKILTAYGPDNGRELAEALNTTAPTAVRANLLKITREELLQKWEGRFSISPSLRSPTALLFSKREPLFALPEFKEGLFEVQDEGSQCIADLIEAKSGDRILDYCSGSGGKSLAIAPGMKGKGELYLHDIRTSSLDEAKRRLRRAGVQNAQLLPPDHPTLSKLLGKMDWVLVDAPCTGTGTLRRNPDMKWKIDAPMVERLVEEQRKIFTQALRYLKPEGKIVYATCSILPEENRSQVEFFLHTLPLVLERELHLLPEIGGCDGFFAAVFRKCGKR